MLPLPPDDALLPRLRDGDEALFASVVDAWSPGLMRLCRAFVRNEAVAEEVVQETWLGVITGLTSFEGRSSFKTWVFTILANRARTRGAREARTQPLSSLADDEDGPIVDADRFSPFGQWANPVAPWSAPSPDAVASAKQWLPVLEAALAEIPERQRAVVLLRDVEGLDAEAVCNLMGVAETNQRVLLHRGRERLRAAIERRLGRG